MINTIFYYPNSKTEYDQQAGNISSRTISFVPMGDTGVIYKNGVRYGSPTADDLRTIFNENPYALPIATASKLGGIMIGKGFNIDPTTGKLDVDFSSITNGSDGQDGHNGLDGLIKTIFSNISNIRASRDEYGIVKIGSGIKVEDGVISVDTLSPSNLTPEVITLLKGDKGDKGDPGRGIVSIVKTSTSGLVDTYTITYTDGTTSTYTVTNGAKGDTGAQGPAGGGGTGSNYDDTELRNLISQLDQAIDALNTTADSESDRLDGVIDGLDGEIQDKIEELLDDSEWIDQNLAGKVQSESNFGDDDVEAYLQRIGMYTVDGNGNKITQWSKISQDVNSLTTTVAALQVQSGDTSAITALQSSLEQYVDTTTNTAINNLSTVYAKKDAESVIEWMYSALKQSSSADKTFNELVSAGKSGLHSGIAELRTYVEKLKNGDYVATASIEAKVDEAIAGLKASASSNNAKTEIFSKINKNSSDIAGIVTACTGDSSSASISTKFANWKSGLITTSTLDGAIATLLATNGTTTSGIMTEAEFNTAKTELVAKNEYTAASIVAKVNDTESTVTINADKININGQNTFISNLTSNSAFIAALQAIDVTAAHSVVAGNSGSYGTIIRSSGISNIKQGNITTSTLGNAQISDPSFYVWAATSGSLLKVSDLTYDTGLSGQGISIAPHAVSNMDWTHPIATFDYNSASLYDDNQNLIAGIYNLVGTGSLSLYNRFNGVGSSFLLADSDGIRIYNNVEATAATKTILITNSTGTILISDTSDNITTTVTDEHISVRNNNSGAYTIIRPGQITLSDGTNTKTITADNQ